MKTSFWLLAACSLTLALAADAQEQVETKPQPARPAVAVPA